MTDTIQGPGFTMRPTYAFRTCHKGPHLLEAADTLYFVAQQRRNPQAWKNYYQAREDYLAHMRLCPYCSPEP